MLLPLHSNFKLIFCIRSFPKNILEIFVKKSSEGAVLYEKGPKSVNEVSLQRGDDIRANVGESVHIKCRKNYVKRRNLEAAKMKQLQP